MARKFRKQFNWKNSLEANKSILELFNTMRLYPYMPVPYLSKLKGLCENRYNKLTFSMVNNTIETLKL